jgi:hypothetical protein
LTGEGFGREQLGLELAAERLSRTVRVGVIKFELFLQEF